MLSNNWTRNERWLSVDDIASYLGIKRDTLYKWITRKDLPCHKVGRLWKFKLVEIDKWVKSNNINYLEDKKAGKKK